MAKWKYIVAKWKYIVTKRKYIVATWKYVVAECKYIWLNGLYRAVALDKVTDMLFRDKRFVLSQCVTSCLNAATTSLNALHSYIMAKWIAPVHRGLMHCTNIHRG